MQDKISEALKINTLKEMNFSDQDLKTANEEIEAKGENFFDLSVWGMTEEDFKQSEHDMNNKGGQSVSLWHAIATKVIDNSAVSSEFLRKCKNENLQYKHPKSTIFKLSPESRETKEHRNEDHTYCKTFFN